VQVVLQRDGVTQHGLVQRIPKEGMLLQGNPAIKGDLIVTYLVSFPDKLTGEQKAGVRKLFG
jgi:DnaJ homolog subfamily B member 4